MATDKSQKTAAAAKGRKVGASKSALLRNEIQNTFSTAIGAFSAGRMTEAYSRFLQAVHLDPQDAQAFYMLAETCIRLGAIEQASMYAGSALALNPTLKAALAVQIEARVRQNDLVHARDLFGQHPASGEQAPMHALLEQRLALAEEMFEVALTDVALLVESTPQLVLARELFGAGFKQFLESPHNGRYGDFIDALGLNFDLQHAEVIRSPWSDPVAGSIDIIIPVHNAVGDLADCLASIRRCADAALRKIILVDDASDRVTRAWLDQYAARNPDVLLVRNSKNLGFTRSVTIGIAQSDAPFFILLNSDTIVSSGWMTGLWLGLAADDRHAMAGPLSNNAYFQSLALKHLPPDIFGTDSARLIDKRAAFVRANGLAAYPKIPFLSGFCLMLRREHYDAVGGLDAERYPRGYWEVQDLALRMIDVGLYPCLVDDVYVHHAQSASIEQKQRDTLISEGFRQICNRHGIVRVLAAEEICRQFPAIRRQSQEVAEFFVARQQVQKLPERHRARPAHHWAVSLPAGTISSDTEVCLFVAHAPYGQLSEYTLHYLQELRRSELKIVVCLAVENVDTPLCDDWTNLADAVVLRENAGFDFGAWADLLRWLPELWTVRRLLFANDSVAGPFQPLAEIFDRIRKEDAGFFALTDATSVQYHAQSYFFGWSSRNLSAVALRSFWEGIENFYDKDAVIEKYEIPLLSLCDMLPDSRHQILFGMHDIFGSLAEMLPALSPAHHAWKALLKSGSPFVKTAVLRHSAAAIDAVSELTGADKAMLCRHVEQSNLNRL